MKSKAINMLSYDDVMDTSAFIPQGIEELVDKDLKNISRKYRMFIEAEEIKKGDIVNICIKGSSDRYNKEQVKVSVGNGFYDEKVEDELIGMHAGETKKAQCNDEEVEFTVLEAKRCVYPEISDEMIKKETEFKTIDEYCEKMKAHHIKQVLHDEARRRANKMIDRIIDESEWYVDEEEIQQYIENTKEKEGVTLNRTQAWDDIAYTLICCKYGNLNPETTEINSREYNAFARLIEQLEETIKIS